VSINQSINQAINQSISSQVSQLVRYQSIEQFESGSTGLPQSNVQRYMYISGKIFMQYLQGG